MIDNHINVVELTDTIKLIFTYPLLSDFKHINKDNQTEMMFELVQGCVKEIHFGNDVYKKQDISKKELTEFFDSLDTEQFKKVSDFFETMPKLRHAIEVTNPKTNVKGEVILQGLQSFLV